MKDARFCWHSPYFGACCDMLCDTLSRVDGAKPSVYVNINGVHMYAYTSRSVGIRKGSRCSGNTGQYCCSLPRQEPGYSQTLTVLVLRGRGFSSFAALVYTMDELDPYRDMPVSSKEDLALDVPEYSTETSGINGGYRGQHADMPPVRTDNGLGHGGQTRVGRREGAPLSAQASYVGICLFLLIRICGSLWIPEGRLLLSRDRVQCFVFFAWRTWWTWWTWTAAALFGSSN